MTKRVWIALLYVAVVGVVVYATGATEALRLESIRANKAELLAFVDARPILSITLFASAYVLVAALSLPAASLLTLLSGFLFGPVLGAVLSILSASTGATIVFLIARTSIGAGLRQKAGPLYARVADGMRKNAFEYLLFLRLVPLFPFFLVNILPALFEVRLRTFVAATVLGIVPGSFVYANLGRELGSIADIDDLASPTLLAAFGLLGLFALLPVGYRWWRVRTRN